ncbi:acyl carrier protein [Candidatus Nitrotoga sp. 1052]|uniref:acyl carrier protein n=1 Tax=Candidatus Nitrotoga sp. 1052 TaxID=2886964 RepID=UPI001EF6E744|nr:phosphopantetheine-binding protein [Candidatus Nitrotoga sp. 1052]CAH1093015.1 Acyl carrier protein [Candidatus Nitrotoga sp. 1052]
MTSRSREELQNAIFDALGAVAPEMDSNAIVPERPLREQIDIDSFDFLNFIIRLHEILGIDIPEKDYAELLTLNSAVEYLARRCASHQ